MPGNSSEALKSYDKHLQTTLSPGGKPVDCKRKPCFRSSAVFVALQKGELKTRILFMGYWLLKRQIPEVQLLVTLRDAGGAPLRRRSTLIQNVKAYSIYLQELLAEAGLDPEANFMGSIELEVFTTRDMVFPYPAFVLNYFNQESVAAVHTAGRIYNDVEDMRENTTKLVPECGFDVLSGERFQPFFNFTNGPHALERNSVEYETVSEDNERTVGRIELGAIEPFGVRHVNLKDHLDLDGLFKSGRGAIKLRHDFRGFFPRFVAGNIDSKTAAASITHTYYDCTDECGDDAFWEKSDPSLYDSSIFAPVWLGVDFYTEVVFYPIYSPTEYTIHLQFFNLNGELKASVNDWKCVKTSEQGVFRISAEEVLREHGHDGGLLNEIHGMKIIKSWDDGAKVPTRLKFGLNIGMCGRETDLPTNVCFNSKIANPAMLRKPETFRWLPILNHAKSVAVINNSSSVKSGFREANIELAVYREADQETIHRKLTIPENGQVRIALAEDDEIRNFLGQDTGWIAARSDNPFVDTWYFDFSDAGVVGGDHGF